MKIEELRSRITPLTKKEQYYKVSSLRLDKMVAALFGISRNKAVDAIHGQYVKLNYKVIEDISKICDNNAIISLRHHGRVKIFITDRRTKQDNYVIEGQYYR